MSDGRPALFDSENLHAVDFRFVRLVLPWNAASTHGTWEAWLDRAQRQGFPILVAPTIDAERDCQTGSCTGPTVAQYAEAVGRLLATYPGIDSVEAWNEPNHALQPTARNAALAAGYHDAAKALCAQRCTVVAGNMLDGSSLAGYLRDYRAALTTTPDVWGIHNYFDATYFERGGVDQVLAIGSTPVWLTETGGLVTFRSPTGTLPYDEHRAADSLRWLFGLAGQSPRIERVYFYGMWEQPWNPFDSALVRIDNTEREGMAVVRAGVGPRTKKLPGPEAPDLILPDGRTVDGSGTVSDRALVLRPPATTTSAGALRLVGRRLQLASGRRTLTVRVRCVGATACSGRLQIRIGSWTSTRTVRLARGKAARTTLRLPARSARGLRARHIRGAWIRVCDAGIRCAAAPKLKIVAAR